MLTPRSVIGEDEHRDALPLINTSRFVCPSPRCNVAQCACRSDALGLVSGEFVYKTGETGRGGGGAKLTFPPRTRLGAEDPKKAKDLEFLSDGLRSHVASSPRRRLRITASSTLCTMSRRVATDAPAFPNIAMSGLPNALPISPHVAPAQLSGFYFLRPLLVP